MFETTEDCSIDLPDIARDPGVSYWGIIERTLHTPWLHVTYCRIDSLEPLRRLVFLTHPEQLLTFAANGMSEISEVDLVLPPYMAPGNVWAMVPVHELWRCRHPIDPKAYAYVFRDRNGNDHLWDIGIERDELGELIRVLSLPEIETA